MQSKLEERSDQLETELLSAAVRARPGPVNEHCVGEYISRCPMPLKLLECQVTRTHVPRQVLALSAAAQAVPWLGRSSTSMVLELPLFNAEWGSYGLARFRLICSSSAAMSASSALRFRRSSATALLENRC